MAIGYILPATHQHELSNPIFSDFLAAASEVYKKSGYDIVLSFSDPNTEIEVYEQMVAKKQVDGFVVSSPRLNDPRIEALNKLGVPFVVHGRSTESDSSQYSWIDVDNEAAFYRATRFLLDLGHKNIAVINGPADLAFSVARTKGVHRAFDEYDISKIGLAEFCGQLTESFGYSVTYHQLSKLDPPTAFVCSSILSAYGILRAINQSGFEMGKDISVVTYDDGLSYFDHDGAEPLFTCARSRVKTAGEMVAQSLLSLIEMGNVRHRQVVLPVDLVLGKSTGRVQLNEQAGSMR